MTSGHRTLRHDFVEFVPDTLEEGVLYISMRFATAAHLCACGCGNKVVTPFTPTDWKLIFDGDTVSIDPSVGSWGFPCQSHYWITSNKIILAPRWSHERIIAGKAHDAKLKARYFADHSKPDNQYSAAADVDSTSSTPRLPFWERLMRWF